MWKSPSDSCNLCATIVLCFGGMSSSGERAITDRYSKIERAEQASVETVDCPLCGCSDATPLLDGADLLHNIPGRFGVAKCARCGFAFTNPRPDAESISKFYPFDYAPHAPRTKKPSGIRHVLRRAFLVEFLQYPGNRSLPRRLALWPLFLLWKHSREFTQWPAFTGKGRILDVGCGAGRYLWKLMQESWSPRGLDTSRHAAQVAKESYGIDVTVGTLPHEHFPPASFEVVTLWNSLEHVADPVAVLTSVAKALAPGGRVLISVTNFDSFGAKHFRERWFPLDLPRHLNHFTPDTLRVALSRAGLVLESVAPLRRSSSLRKSAAYALAAGDRRIFTRLCGMRAGASLAKRIVGGAATCDLMFASASKTPAGKSRPPASTSRNK